MIRDYTILAHRHQVTSRAFEPNSLGKGFPMLASGLPCAKDIQALQRDILTIWQLAAALSVAGKMSLTEQRDLAEALQVWAAYVRNGKNKTHTAIELRRSRRAVRRVVRFIESDESAFPETIRRVLLRSPVRPSFEEIIADLTNGVGELEGTVVHVQVSIDAAEIDLSTK